MWRPILFTALLVGIVKGFSQGAPDSACNTLLPGHGHQPQTTVAPFTITPSVSEVTAGQRITVTLAPADGTPFKGFLIQGRDSDSNQVTGTFFTQDHNYLTCGKGFSNSVTHSNPSSKLSVVLEWEPPSDYQGDVMFIATFLRSYDTFWTGVTSEKVTVLPPKAIVFPAIPTSPPTTTTTTSTAAPTQPTTTKASVSDQSLSVNAGKDAIVVVDAPHISSQSSSGGELGSVGEPGTVGPPDSSSSGGAPSDSSNSSSLGVVTGSDSLPVSPPPTGSPTPPTIRGSTKSFGTLKKKKTTTTTTASPTTTSTTSMPPKDDIREPVSPAEQNLASALTNIYQGCEISKGCFGLPKNCEKKSKCKAMVTYTKDVSGGYLFELVADANLGYVAAAISDDKEMGKDSVMICRNFEDDVDAVMGWNVKDAKSNVLLVDRQLALSDIQTGQVDGKIICRFIREKKTEINDVTFDLDNEKHHLMVAYGQLKTDGNLQYHIERQFSASPLSLSQFEAIESASDLFKLLHACFMIGAWIGTASCGILFARYYKKTWVNSACCSIDQWFHWHRFFMILTWLLTTGGVAVIAYYLKGWTSVPPSTNPHALIGIVSFGLCFIQPFMALCRPAPTAKNRPIFNWFHWGVGNLAQIFGIAAILFGLDLYGGIPQWSWWIVIAFVAFHCVMHLILSIGQCIADSRTQRKGDVYPLKNMNSSRDPLHPGPEKKDAPGSVFRKMMLALYLLVNWAFTALLILVVVIEEDQLRDWNLLFWEDID